MFTTVNAPCYKPLCPPSGAGRGDLDLHDREMGISITHPVDVAKEPM